MEQLTGTRMPPSSPGPFRPVWLPLGALAVLSVLTVLSTLQVAAAPPPPIVLIVADDMAYADLSCYGGSTPTPQIDSLARNGVRFTRFYANSSECSPTRTALLTGRYQQRVGGMECALGTGNVGRYDDAIRLREQRELGLPVAENTLLAGLKQAGYRTAISGKWHLGYEPKFSPVAHGFDASFGPNAGGVDYFHHTEWDGVPALFEDGAPVKRDGYMTDLITDFAVRQIERRDDPRPLFLYVPYTAPHTPYQGPKDRTATPLREPQWNEGTPEIYAAMLRSLDAGVGRILQALAARGLAEEALVIFMSDNGGTKLGNSGPYSRLKGTLYEGGVRVPCLVRWPGRLPRGATTDQTTATMDFTRSLLRIAAPQAAPARALDGMDILAHVAENKPDEPRTLFWRYRRGETTWRAALIGDLKLVQRQDGANLQRELFDLAADPAEKNDLVARRPIDADRLEAALAGWQLEVRAAR
jgi:arylsulfatase A-like enzyme